MKLKKLKGVIIALPTPLLKDEDVDTESLCRLIDYSISEGADGLMILGSMGEGTALVDSQRQIVVETSVAHVAGRVPLLATVSAVSTRKCVEFAKDVDRLGVDYVVTTSPFYYKFPDPRSIILHIERIAGAVSVPVIFYNASGSTGNNVDVDTAEKILNLERVAGVKDSSCNYANFMELIRRYPDKNERPAVIMQGDESVFDASLLLGADGVVTGGGVIFIRLLTELYKYASSGKTMKAIEIQRKFSGELGNLLGPDLLRNWLYNIKQRLVDMQIISHAYSAAPFLSPVMTSPGVQKNASEEYI
jgi:4-hydroxy-tetrahydrodipicolinate synthase